MNYPQIGAYYQCYKQPKAFLHTLAAYREKYPSSSLLISCDNGHDFSKAAEFYNAQYTHYTSQTGNDVTSQLLSFENAKLYIERFLTAAYHIKEDYFILLEDDVMVFHPIPGRILTADIIGCNREGAIIYPEIIANLQTFNPSVQPQAYYGGCGGSLFRTAFFKSLANKVLPILNDILAEYSSINPKFDSDILLSYLTLRFHGTVTGPPIELSEPYYTSLPQLIKDGHVCVLHQFKHNYNKPLTKEERAILGWEVLDPEPCTRPQ
jgi:hypothetical protein